MPTSYPKLKPVSGEDRNVTRARAILRDWNRDTCMTLDDLSEKWHLPVNVVSSIISINRLKGNFVRD